jgi:hypothetical protein
MALPATNASATPTQPPATAASQTVTVSNETTHTEWALASFLGAIRAAPSLHARRISKLSFATPDDMGLEPYPILSEQSGSGGTWMQIRVPGRPNGRIGWVPRGALTAFHVVHTELIVNRASRTLRLFRNGHQIFQAPVGVGKPSTPTPPGHFWITEAFVSTDPFYGPYAFGTSDASVLSEWPGGGIVGLHGTNEPNLVPGDPSHGCIRLHNSDILRLKSLLPIGTPLWIQ